MRALSRRAGISPGYFNRISQGLAEGLNFDKIMALSSILPHTATYLTLVAIERSHLYNPDFVDGIRQPSDLKVLEGREDLPQLLNAIALRARKIASSRHLDRAPGEVSQLLQQQLQNSPFTSKGLQELGEILLEARVKYHSKISFYQAIDLFQQSYHPIELGIDYKIPPHYFCKFAKVVPYTAADLLVIALGLGDRILKREITTTSSLKDLYPVIGSWSITQLLEAISILSEMLTRSLPVKPASKPNG